MSRNQAIKQALKNAIYANIGAASYFSGANWLRRRLNNGAPQLRVLMYHKVNDLPGNVISVSPGLFRQQMTHLKAHYEVLSPTRLLDIIEGREELPPRAALLTFDDGYRDNMECAYPILKELGLSAILFVPTDFIGGERLLPHDESLGLPNPTLTWEQLSAIQDVFTIGSHGRSHRVLTQMPFAEAAEEIANSKTLIEKHVETQVRFFSYPKGSTGDFSDDLEAQVRKAGYAASFSTLPGANALSAVRGGSLLRRYNAEPFGAFTFARLLDGSCDLIALKDTSFGVSWKRTFNNLLGTTTR